MGRLGGSGKRVKLAKQRPAPESAFDPKQTLERG